MAILQEKIKTLEEPHLEINGEMVVGSCTKAHLKLIDEFKRKAIINIPKGFHYRGAEDFVLQNGKEYKVDYTKLNSLGYGRPQRCFKNCADFVIENKEFTYVEGFAATVIPTLHAWVVDETGVIYDLTWRLEDRNEDFLPHCYFGVEFPTPLVMRMLCATEKYGFIDSWESDWPLFKRPFEIPKLIGVFERWDKKKEAR